MAKKGNYKAKMTKKNEIRFLMLYNFRLFPESREAVIGISEGLSVARARAQRGSERITRRGISIVLHHPKGADSSPRAAKRRSA